MLFMFVLVHVHSFDDWFWIAVFEYEHIPSLGNVSNFEGIVDLTNAFGIIRITILCYRYRVIRDGCFDDDSFETTVHYQIAVFDEQGAVVVMG